MRSSPHKHLSNPVFHEPVFGEGGMTPDPLGFGIDHPSDDAVYREIEDLLKKDVVPFPASRLAPDGLFSLAEAYGARGSDVVAAIETAGRIVFHAVGDTGSSSQRKYRNELRVADQMSVDCRSDEAANRPCFLFHLGDVVYSFGEAAYYYDQFYEPYRAYGAPIFAIPGNHDSFIVPGTAEADEPLVTFTRNFCADAPTVTPEAGGLHRTSMIQPGVYFALDAPFVRVIAMFSNALEDPGLISSQNGRWPGVPDIQLDFLRRQLRKVKQEGFAGALLFAMHHPPFSYSPPPAEGATSANHAGSTAMLAEIDAICAEEGVYPHAFLSAHAHCYQRYTRTITFEGSDREVPFVVCGNGGHNVNPLVRGTRKQPAREPENASDVGYLDPQPAVDAKGLILEKYDDHDYGYLRISVDRSQLRIAYHQAAVRSLLQSRYDLVTVDLASRSLVAN